jgi:hypothetical protein
MAPGYSDCLRVVETKAGPGTGETRYRTSDGRWWREQSPCVTDSTTGVDVRYQHGDFICQHK